MINVRRGNTNINDVWTQDGNVSLRCPELTGAERSKAAIDRPRAGYGEAQAVGLASVAPAYFCTKALTSAAGTMNDLYS